MKKKLAKFILSLILVLSSPISVLAEGDTSTDYSDTGYWTALCTGDDVLSADQKTACRGFLNYQSSQTESMQKRIQEIESQREQLADNIQDAAQKVQEYQNQADALNASITDYNAQIADKQTQIDVLEKKIEALQQSIDERQGQIDEAEAKIRARLVSMQPTMRLNQYLDILMGARSFNDLIRIANGLSDITAYDEKRMDDLSDDIKALNADQADLENTESQIQDEQSQLETLRQSVQDEQNNLLVLKYQQQVLEEQYESQYAELEAEGNRIAANIEEIRAQMAEMQDKLNAIAASSGWIIPVPAGHKSAGTWAYSGGGTHLGEDFAAKIGSPIYAVGNGVVINSSDGCGYGHLGDGCGQAGGGSWGGGNQVYLLTIIGGRLYAVKYLHMLAGTPAAKGTIVSQGDQIGQVGSSGNSTGPHCHIEVFYLGDSSSFSKYATSWNGDLAFGCGWGSAALARTCDKVGAPCRYRPETFFGG